MEENLTSVDTQIPSKSSESSLNTNITQKMELKRSRNDNDDEDITNNDRKKYKSENVVQPRDKSIMDLSEDVLLTLFSFVTHSDLINMARTCTRMDRVVRDWTLWNSINSLNSSIRMTNLQDFAPYLLESTQSINLKFDCETITSISNLCTTTPAPLEDEPETQVINDDGKAYESLNIFLSHLSSHCKNLHTLCLENITIDGKKFQLHTFPTTLKKLSLRHSTLINLKADVSYFYGFNSHFPNIEVMDLSWCSWFTPHSLIAISKSRTLQELYLKGCRKLKNCVPYTSLSVRFGFKGLRVLDLRYTYVGDSEISIIYDMPCLTHLYLAAPSPKRLDSFSISDRSITMLCSMPAQNQLQPVQQHLHAVQIHLVQPVQADRANNEIAHTSKTFHTLVVAGYPSITDITLRHASQCLKGLKNLDIRGSSCTEEAITQFKIQRPEVNILYGPDPEPHPPHLLFSPPSPTPTLPDLRVVLQRINHHPLIIQDHNNVFFLNRFEEPEIAVEEADHDNGVLEEQRGVALVIERFAIDQDAGDDDDDDDDIVIVNDNYDDDLNDEIDYIVGAGNARAHNEGDGNAHAHNEGDENARAHDGDENDHAQ